jgi:hypothetical protein
MYPRLPSATMSDNMTTGYPTASSAAPPSTLSGAFDHDDRRRYTGGTLQRARPAEREADEHRMDTSADGERTPTKEHPSITSSLIDPALSTASDPDQEAAQRTAQAATEVAERDVNVAWVEKVRLLENLRRLVSELLEQGRFDGDSAGHNGAEESPASSGDGAMDGIETASTRAFPEHGKESPKSEASAAVLYPTLRGVDEDGDAKMPVDE